MGFGRPIVAVPLLMLGAALARSDDGPIAEQSIGRELCGAPILLSPPTLPGQRATGSVFVGYRGIDGETTGAIGTISPGWRSFIRAGVEVTPRSIRGDVRAMWEVGIEDWRDRSFFLRVHDWGPVGRRESVMARTAAEAGYKLPRLCGAIVCLASTALVALPLSGGPYLGARATVAIQRTWFLAGGLGWAIPGATPGAAGPDRWRLSFAAGRWGDTPGALFVSYRDELRVDRLDATSVRERQGNGVVALGVNAAF